MIKCFIGNREFFNRAAATEYAITESKRIGIDDHVRLIINIHMPDEPLYKYDYKLEIYHNGQRVYFDDPSKPNGYKKDETS